MYSSIFTLDADLSKFWSPLGRLWTTRWQIVAKAVQLGYNLLHIDNDVMLTQDVYRYLKHPVFLEYNLIALGSAGLIGINCGVVYIQNAHPAGPTGWAAYQVPDRTLRWLENEDYILPLLNTTQRGKLQDIGFEQSVFNDAVWATVSGKPFFAHSMRPQNTQLWHEWEKFHNSIGPGNVKSKQVTLPKEWEHLPTHDFNASETSIRLKYYDMQLVHSGSRDERLGPFPFPSGRGKMSKALVEFIVDSATEVWPRWEDSHIDEEILESRKEKFLLAPGWLMGGWNKDGWHGYWHIQEPHVIIAHFVGIGGKHQQGKKLGFKVAGWWHYEASKMLYGPKIFWSSTDTQPFPKLLVIDPSILIRAHSVQEFMQMHLGLIIAGLMSDRVWVWPVFDCKSHRASPSLEKRHWTGTRDKDVLYFGGPGNLKCIDLTLTWNYCMQKGMSWPDFQEYARCKPIETTQTESNTLIVTGPVANLSGPTATDSTLVTALNLKTLRSNLDTLYNYQVVYTSGLFTIAADSDNERSCIPNCAYDDVAPGLSRKLAKFEEITGCYPFNGFFLPKL